MGQHCAGFTKSRPALTLPYDIQFKILSVDTGQATKRGFCCRRRSSRRRRANSLRCKSKPMR